MSTGNRITKTSVVINGGVGFNYVAQIFNSDIFKELLLKFIVWLEKRNSPILDAITPFKDEDGEFDFEIFKDFLYVLNLDKFLAVIERWNLTLDIPLEIYRKVFIEFIEGLYSFWRSKQRFMVVDQPYSTVHSTNRYRVRELANTNESLKHLILSLYRSLLFNIDDRTQKTYRQLSCAAQVSFLINKFDIEIQARVNNPTFYEIPYIWQTVFEPPVIFYTRSIKRKGIFPVKNKNYLHKIKLDKENMYGLPIMVGDLLIVIYVEVDFLELGAGIANLFEIAEPEEFTRRKPDGFVLFGLPEEQFSEDEMRGVVFKEDGIYYGMLPNIDEMDYFGYMKKMVLTVHNLIRIDRGSLPVHGAFARIITKQNKKANIMLIGDSGAGKSETLEAINKLPEEYNAKVDILIDDMGSLHINEEGDITAVGTEIGAFVRLDDLTPGYAYNTMDRSIFMNPNVVNARVIVPQMTYENISTPTRVDYLFYINNFEEIGEDKPVLYFFDDLDEAYDTFAEGMRMAKGTTGEVGITTSYFANPFGAVQRRGVHETIARRYFNQMEINGIHIGTIRTQLGIPGYEQDGPIEAAKALIDFINET